MIALVNLMPETTRATGVEPLDSLPEPPALRWSGFLIRCNESLTGEDVVQWSTAVRQRRPVIPVGIVARPDANVLRSIASSGLIFAPLLLPEDLPGGRVSSSILDDIRKSSVEARVVEHWLQRYGAIDAKELPVLYTLAAHAVRGGRIKSIRTSIDYSLATLARRLRKRGYPSPGVLLREGRIASVQIRFDAGVVPRLAREAAGWYSAEMYSRARKQFRDDAKCGGG